MFKQTVFLFLACISLLAKPSQNEWQEIYNKNGTTVFRSSVSGSDTFAFRSLSKIAAPLNRVASIISDINRRTEWMPDVGDTWIVEQINEHERIDYIQLKTPFIIKDRELVLKSNTQWNKEEGVFTIHLVSTDHPKVKKSKRVRAELFESSYTLKRRGGFTEVEFTVHVDPKGSVPKWLVNFFQTDYPVRTIEALQNQSTKKDIVILPSITKAIPEDL